MTRPMSPPTWSPPRRSANHLWLPIPGRRTAGPPEPTTGATQRSETATTPTGTSLRGDHKGLPMLIQVKQRPLVVRAIWTIKEKVWLPVSHRWVMHPVFEDHNLFCLLYTSDAADERSSV